MMNTAIRISIITASVLFMAATESRAASAMPKGEDVIHAPALGEGLCVHNMFQSNMVIQRDKPIRVRGWAAPGENVTVSFAGQNGSAKADKDRAWVVELAAQEANSDAQTMTVKGASKTLTLENILIGDVWVLGGQSNMEHPVGRIEDGDLMKESARFQNIRLLTIPAADGAEHLANFERLHEWSGWWGRHFPKGDWDVCSPEVIQEFSGIGFVFGQRLHLATQVPIGIIDASRGGTTVEAWTPVAVMKAINTPEVTAMFAEWDEKVAVYDPEADLKRQIERHHSKVEKRKKEGKEIPADWKVPTKPSPGPAFNQNRPGNCYASMISPIAGFPVKGAIWHQGYNNALQQDGHVRYYQIFPEMIKAWRAAFGDPEMPFGSFRFVRQGIRSSWTITVKA